MNNEYVKKYKEIFLKYGFNFARMVSGSKSGYSDRHPEHLVIFNARIYTKDLYIKYEKEIQDFFKGQIYEIWYGDLDLNKDLYKLYRVHLDIGNSLIITSEHGRKILEIG